MKKTERLFRIIDRLRGHNKAVTAETLAAELGVSVRTIYRDMKALENQAIPVQGEAGVGYMLGPGFDAPPLAFDNDELDALVIGLRLVQRDADPILKGAALSALEKIRVTSKSPELLDTPIYAPDFGRHEHLHMMSTLRVAIRNATVMTVEYEALSGEHTLRTIKPLALIFFPRTHLLATWCHLRKDYRNFRIDRIISCIDSGENFTKEKTRLLRGYHAHVKREIDRHKDNS
ncbi:MAG: DNA-binding transcriptional regulator [Robiginitomaculum sp.]|nr:MAG: DNA-binding transcriptional regulator [Robiginitomaculum sp.]